MHRFMTLAFLAVVVLAPELALAQATPTPTIDFHQFGGPDLFDNIAPPIVAAGATISGGEILAGATFLSADMGTVYGTASFCNGCLPTITINFSQPVANFSVEVLNGLDSGANYFVTDDQGDLQFQSLESNSDGGAGVIALPSDNISQVTIYSDDNTDWDFLIGYLIFTPSPSSLSLVDPNPGLLGANGVVTDPEKLATGGTLVTGVAADGATPLLVRIPAAVAGDNLAITIINDQGNPSSSIQQDGVLEPVGGAGNPGTLTVPAVSTNEGNMGFAVYIPPIDFDRNGQDDNATSRSISLQVTESPATTPTIRHGIDAAARTRRLAATPGAPVQLVRPAVILVHGIWADQTTWNGFSDFFNGYGIKVYTPVYNQALGSTLILAAPEGLDDLTLAAKARYNSLGFAFNAPFVMAQIQVFLARFRQAGGVADLGADVVTHSMGGNICRAIEQLPGFIGTGNNGRRIPLFHKLITIDTPHLGTPLAAQLLQNGNQCIRTLMARGGLYAFSDVALTSAPPGVPAGSVNGAVADLQNGNFDVPNSNPVPTAMMAATINMDNLSGLDTSGWAKAAHRLCPNDPLVANLTSAGWPNVFGGAPSDAIVPLSSQIPGTFMPGMSPTIFNGAVHSAGTLLLGFNGPVVLQATDSQGFSLMQRILQLLNADITGSGYFSVL